MDRALRIAAIGEAATGAALVLAPSPVASLLLGEPVSGAGATAARVAGLALIGLGLACWPGPPRRGMLAYGAAVAVLLAAVGIAGAGGPLLWPAVALHVALAVALLASGGRA